MRDKLLVFIVLLFQGIVFSSGEEENVSEYDINEKEKDELKKDSESFSSTQVGNDQPTFFEGDMVDTAALQRLIENKKYEAETGETPFDAASFGKWPNGVVPYTIDSGFSQTYRTLVKKAIEQYHNHTCIKWIPRTTQRDYVTFFHGRGCYSYVGHQSQPDQRISIGYRCRKIGIVMHEMMHCLGFFHEQSRVDRDKYITIKWRNVKSRAQNNFKKYLPGQASTLGEPYDKRSVMHYNNYAFAIDRRYKTIISVANVNERFGQREGFSKIDIIQLNKHYGCAAKKAAKTTPKPTATKSNCKTTKMGLEYRGTISKTISGRICQAWASQTPHSHSKTPSNWPRSGLDSNYCRNPSQDSDLWCYTMDKTKRWEACAVPFCRFKPDCEDVYPFCTELKSKWCRHSWVARNCQKSCDGCPTFKPTTVKPTTVKPTTVKPTTVKPTTVKPTTVKPAKPTTEPASRSEICRDIKGTSDCGKWATGGYCTNVEAGYILFMKRNCKKSCGLCGTPRQFQKPPCKDNRNTCLAWKKRRLCTTGSYIAFMKTNCAKTCGIC